MAHEIRLGYQQRPEGKLGTQVSLTTVAVDFTLARFSLPRPGARTGPQSSEPPLVLNPLFLELLMGLPTDWTGSGPAETELSLWRSRMRGALSTLASTTRSDQDRLL